MSMTDTDLELLETWLDGELPDEQVEALRRRVSAEPELSQALDRLRADRALRTRMWQELEPSNQEMDALVSSVRRSVRREDLIVSRFRVLRNVSAIAASIAMVFMAGWFSRNRLHIGPLELNGGGIATISPAGTGPDLTNIGSIILGRTPSSSRVPVGPDGFSLVRSPAEQQFRVVVYDARNNVRLTRDLDRIEDAARFVDELARLQNPKESAKNEPVFVDHLRIP